MIPQETALDLPISVQVSLAAGLGALTVAVHVWDILKEVTIIFITSTIVSVQLLSCVRLFETP